MTIYTDNAITQTRDLVDDVIDSMAPTAELAIIEAYNRGYRDGAGDALDNSRFSVTVDQVPFDWSSHPNSTTFSSGINYDADTDIEIDELLHSIVERLDDVEANADADAAYLESLDDRIQTFIRDFFTIRRCK